ncbi:uncharacterized protein LOC130047214 [Ostrea edulis]|uniref:uncharacterized protein LOC130047214 n=1 Tax=Ostrea edulis TaxID=37623 RepID=UPI0024AFFE14|nr:uncharacterized protein LOC130047214 [Ostrea edulis]
MANLQVQVNFLENVVTVDNILVSFGRPHNHKGDFIGLAAESFVRKVKKRCRDEAAPIPSIYDEELGALRNADCDDTVVDMIKQIPTFQSCKSVLENEDFHRLVRRAAVLPLVPDHRVEDVWFQALEDNDDNTDAIMRFKDYVTETWVEGHFHLWNHFDHDGPRTTNAVEGWHHKLNRMCRRAHPNIFVFVEMLKKEQAANEAKIIQITARGVVRPKKKKYRQLDSRLQRLKDRMRQGQMDIVAYADAASHLIHFE